MNSRQHGRSQLICVPTLLRGLTVLPVTTTITSLHKVLLIAALCSVPLLSSCSRSSDTAAADINVVSVPAMPESKVDPVEAAISELATLDADLAAIDEALVEVDATTPTTATVK